MALRTRGARAPAVGPPDVPSARCVRPGPLRRSRRAEHLVCPSQRPWAATVSRVERARLSGSSGRWAAQTWSAFAPWPARAVAARSLLQGDGRPPWTLRQETGVSVREPRVRPEEVPSVAVVGSAPSSSSCCAVATSVSCGATLSAPEAVWVGSARRASSWPSTRRAGRVRRHRPRRCVPYWARRPLA